MDGTNGEAVAAVARPITVAGFDTSRLLLRVESPDALEFYINEAIGSNWNTRMLERQINSFF